jgi:DNA-binding transcriptional regulator YdaS (Cro superfamily)
MPLYTQKEYDEIRKLAWLEVVRIFGSQRKLANFLDVEQSTISTWINKSNAAIPYETALAITEKTKISINRLLPNHPITNYFNKLYANKLMVLENMSISKILIADLKYLPYPQPDRHIIVATNGILISGLVELEAYKLVNKDLINVILLDLESLYLELSFIKDFPYKFTIMEIVAIGCALKQLLGKRQGQRTDLGFNQPKNQINSNKLSILVPNWGLVPGKTDKKIAKILEFSKGTYLRVVQIYLNGSKELINALHNNQISINKASIISKLPKEQQFTQLKKENNYV